jgi:hypothetical protein
MPTPFKPAIGTKTDFAIRPAVPVGQKEAAAEFNLLVQAVQANFERLILSWETDIGINQVLTAGQYVLYLGSIFKITTTYSVGSPITWVPANAQLIGSPFNATFNEGLKLESNVAKLGDSVDPALNPIVTPRYLKIDDGGSFVIRDNRTVKVGLKYANDYSPTFELESLITKRAANDIIISTLDHNIDGGVADSIYNEIPRIDGGLP